MAEEGWEIVYGDPFNRVRRIQVPGGWLYQVEKYEDHIIQNTNAYSTNTTTITGWYPPVFVAK